MKRFLLFLLVLLAVYVSLELLSLLGLEIIARIRHVSYAPIATTSLSEDHARTLRSLFAQKTTYLVHSPHFGWSIKPNGSWHGLYQANAQGMRATKEYPLQPGNKTVRIATFGNSFTHGDDVANRDTWQEQLMSDAPGLEVLNFGFGGYGLDQAFLRYKLEGLHYNAQIVFIGFMEENINRLVNVYRPFYLPGIPLTKPRFFLRKNELVLLPNPLAALDDYRVLLDNPEPCLRELGKNDYHFSIRPKEGTLDFSPLVRLGKLCYYVMYQGYLRIRNKSIYRNGYFNQASEAFTLCTRLFDRFYSLALENNSLPIILLFPNRSDIKRYRTDKTKVYAPLLHHFAAAGYHYIDLIDAFENPGKTIALDDLFGAYHYTPLANAMVSHFILGYLEEHNLTGWAGIEKARVNKGLVKSPPQQSQ